MSAYDTPSQESSGTDIEDRTRRALERVLTVTHTDGTPIAADESPTVVGATGGQATTPDDSDSTDSAGSDSRLDPRVREHVEEHGSHDYAGVAYPPTE